MDKKKREKDWHRYLSLRAMIFQSFGVGVDFYHFFFRKSIFVPSIFFLNPVWLLQLVAVSPLRITDFSIRLHLDLEE